MKICLFGGSFDPVHEGHLCIAERAVRECGLDEVRFLPCSRSPLKETAPGATDRQRLDMLELATARYPWAIVDPTDLQGPPPSWSWRLAEHFRHTRPDDELFWLMGTDQWKELEKWGRWEYLASLVTFLVHHRGELPRARPGVRAFFLDGHHPASASGIREERQECEDWLPVEVARYIEQYRLY